jgi:DNA-binding NarL/FixJ family response regulator
MQITIAVLAVGLALSAAANAALVKRLMSCGVVQIIGSSKKTEMTRAQFQSEILDEVSCDARISVIRRKWGVATGDALIPPAIDSGLADRFGLTDREDQVAALMLRGYCNSRIAADLVISQSTVKSHVYSIFRKLGVHSRQEVIDMFEAKQSKKDCALHQVS